MGSWRGKKEVSGAMQGRSFYTESLKIVGLLLALMVGIKLTKGGLMIGVVLAGMMAALSNRRGLALSLYLLLPFFVVINPLIVPPTVSTMLSARIGGVLMILCLVLASSRASGSQTLPLGALFAFFIVAVISSTTGYFPMISYFKIANCVIFLIGLYFGTKNINRSPADLYLLRKMFYAFSVIIIFGSLATLPFPAVAYFTSARQALAGGTVADANELIRSTSGMTLFSGITYHSQFLSPMTSCLIGWLLLDMIIVERRVCKLHIALLAVAPIILFMTRGRVGFVSFMVALFMVFIYCIPRLRIPTKLKSRLHGFLVAGGILLVIGAAVAEVRSHAMTRWLTKTDDVAADNRSFVESFTESRMGKIEIAMAALKKNPLWGMGFQVEEDHPYLYKLGRISLFSAPVEQGVIFTAVLGETGICGMMAFLMFIMIFASTCMRKHYYATLSLFMVYLATNLAEATFFSPGGGGGIMWLVTVAGGFVIDLTARNMERFQARSLSFRL